MLLRELNPFVRLVGHFYVSEDSADAFCNVQTRDNRLFYVSEGKGAICVGGGRYDLSTDCCMVIRAGQGYRIEPSPRLRLIVVNFDYTDRCRELEKSFHPFVTGFPGILEDVRIEDAPMLSAHICEKNAERLAGGLLRMVSEFMNPGPWREDYLSSALKTVLIDLVRGGNEPLSGEDAPGRTVREVIGYLRENYAEPIDSETLAKIFHFTPGYINRLFKREVGMPVHQYLITLRVDVAKKLLASGEYSPSETAGLIGFADYPHFSKTFKRLVGQSPSRWRNSSGE